MKSLLDVSIVSPEGTLFEGMAINVVLPGKKSPFAVFESHAGIVSELVPGVLTVWQEQKTNKYVIESGFVEVKENRVIALVDYAIEIADIDAEDEQELLTNLIEGKTDLSTEDRLKKIELTRVKLRSVA